MHQQNKLGLVGIGRVEGPRETDNMYILEECGAQDSSTTESMATKRVITIVVSNKNVNAIYMIIGSDFNAPGVLGC